jgi:hypothetical protein
MRAFWVLLFASVVAMAGGEQRTWTFIDDGTMHSPSGGRWSFKKNGRLDAAFIRSDGTNVILMCVADGKYRIIPAASLSDGDRTYLRTANGIAEVDGVDIELKAVAKSAEASRKAEAARFKAEAASKRRVAELDMADALRLENDAGRLGSRAASLEGQADHRARVADKIENSAVVRPRVGLAYVTTKADSAVKSDAADRLEEDMGNLRREAREKRADADRLSREATQLEGMARSMEFGAASPTPASR